MSNIGAMIPGLIGMAGDIAGKIPGLKKPKRDTAGSKAASQASHKMSKGIVGAAATGHSASRGLALREGLRAATDAGAQGAREAGNIAYQEQADFTAAKEERNARIADFASGAASGLAQMGQGLIQQKENADSVQQTVQDQPEMGENLTGLTAPNAGMLMNQQDQLTEHPVDPNGPDLDDLDAEEQAEIDAEAGPIAKFKTRKALDEALMTAPMTQAPDIEVELEQRLQMKNLMLQEAERLGINLGEVSAQITRKLGLNPGQSTKNPMGLSLDYTGEE